MDDWAGDFWDLMCLIKKEEGGAFFLFCIFFKVLFLVVNSLSFSLTLFLLHAQNLLKLLLFNAGKKNQLGRTPLMLAARYGHSKIASLLLKAGAFVDAVDKVRDTRLFISLIAIHEGIQKKFSRFEIIFFIFLPALVDECLGFRKEQRRSCIVHSQMRQLQLQ